ncbi:MAG: hypothetical protein QOJ52_1520 [Acidimicrobiaceae bacterium]|nr:hypothetical protein [Acidimicrobiaceae bacterium]
MSATTGSTHPGHRATALSRMEKYRLRQQGLAAAAACPEGTDVLWGPSATFADRIDLAGAAQDAWWHAVLARVDATLDDDMSAMAPEARRGAVRDAWAAQLCATPGYLPLAALGAGDRDHDARERRYARVLALFAGAADVADDADVAAEAGLDLVRQLSAGRRLVSSHP